MPLLHKVLGGVVGAQYQCRIKTWVLKAAEQGPQPTAEPQTSEGPHQLGSYSYGRPGPVMGGLD